MTCGVLAAAAIMVGWMLRPTLPIGHWNSPKGRDAFIAAYDVAMAEMPAPDETINVRTSYGIVRLYRFEGLGTRETPLVLLPGTQSASPV